MMLLRIVLPFLYAICLVAIDELLAKGRGVDLPFFWKVKCRAEHHSYTLCILVDYRDGGKKDRLLLNEDPASSVILKGHLESNPTTFVVVILSDEDSPASNTIAFSSERYSSCNKFSVEVKFGKSRCIMLHQGKEDEDAMTFHPSKYPKESQRSILEQALLSRKVDVNGYRLDLVVFYDDSFRDKFGDRSFTRISSIMALVAEQYSEASFKTKLQITLTQVKHIVGQNWGALQWNERYPNSPLFTQLALLAEKSDSDANLFMFFTVNNKQLFAGLVPKIGSICDESKEKRVSINRYLTGDADTAMSVAHEIAHILGIGHDCINDECRFWKNIYVGPRKYDGKDCYGYMDYWMDTTGWSECSAADFASYVTSHASFCLDKIGAASVKNIEKADYKNTLPIDYGGKNKCTWSCDQWAGIGGDGNNYCSDDWSTKRHCVPTTSGKIKDYCQASCNRESHDAIACNKFTLTSEGGARRSQANRLGQYVKEDTRTYGRASYRNYKQQQYLYWMNGYWLVGKTKGKEYGGLLNSICIGEEYIENGKCNNGWKYWSGQWKSDDTILMTCDD